MRYTTFRIMPCVAISEATVRDATDTPEKLHDFWQDVVAAEPDHDPSIETLVTVILDTRLRATSWHRTSTGTLSETCAHPREILRPVIMQRGHSLAVIHNHPSGDPSPSAADIRFTKRIKEAAEIMEIQLLDHLVTTDPRHSVPGREPYYSFRESGTL